MKMVISSLATQWKVPHDAVAFGSSASLMVATVESVKLLARTGLFSPYVTRKLMHMAAGPVFMLTWPFFESRRSAWVAACVPLAMTLKFALVGFGILQNDADVRAMSRTGDRAELLRGPLLYGVVFVISTLLWFREMPAGVALLSLCFGDGLADVIGRKFGHEHKLPWSARKSWAGSLGFLASSFVACALGAQAFFVHGWSTTPAVASLAPLLIASLVGALVESLPMADVDNLFVPLAVSAAFLASSSASVHAA